MAAKVLIYIHYDRLQYENDLNVWMQTEAGKVSQESCWDSNDVDGFIDFVCSELGGENEIDLRIVRDRSDDLLNISEKLIHKNMRLLEKSKSAWTKNEIIKIVREFNSGFGDGQVTDSDLPCQTTEEFDTINRKTLADLMIEMAKGEYR